MTYNSNKDTSMRYKLLIITLLTIAFAPFVLAGSYSKSCSDDVCTITKNGVVTYEGDADKIAKIKEKKAQEENLHKEFDEKWIKADKKSKDEPVRVAVMIPTAGDQGLYAARKAYYKMMVRELTGKPNVVVVPWKEMKEN